MKTLLSYIRISGSHSLKVVSCSLLLAACVVTCSYAQDKSASEYQVKAIFLYNFTQFVDWPPAAFKNADDPFIIGIIGDDPFGPYLDEAVAGEKIGSRPIIVKRFHDINSASNCHMLYINSKDREWVSSILSSISEKNILTVSDVPSFNNLGGIIRFYTEENKIRLQINLIRSKAAQLTISSKLLSLAKTN